MKGERRQDRPDADECGGRPADRDEAGGKERAGGVARHFESLEQAEDARQNAGARDAL